MIARIALYIMFLLGRYLFDQVDVEPDPTGEFVTAVRFSNLEKNK